MKILIGATVLVAGGVVGVLTTTNMRLATRVEELEERLAQVEKLRTESVARGRENGRVGLTSRPADPVGLNAGGGDDVAKQLAALRAKVEDLQKSAAGAGSGTAADLAAPSGDAPGAPPAALAEGQRQAIEQVVADVLQKREEEREKERVARMEEMAKERVNGILDQLTNELGLSVQQRDAIAPILNGTMKQVSDLMMGRRDTGQRDAMGNVVQQDVARQNMREEMGKLVADADVKVKAQLTAEQGTKYDEWRKANPVGPGFMVRFGPGGGGAVGGGGQRGPVLIEAPR